MVLLAPHPLVSWCRRLIDQPHQAFTMGLVIAVHGLLLGAMLVSRVRTPPPVAQDPIAVTFVAEAREDPPLAAPRPAPPVPASIQIPLPPRPSFSEIAVSVQTEQVTLPVPVTLTPNPMPVTEVHDAVVPPEYTAAYLNNPGPQYPYVSRRRREQGTVLLKVLVDAGGSPLKVLIGRSSGFVALDEAAVDIVRKRWRFAPAKQGNEMVEAWVEIPMEFSLKDR